MASFLARYKMLLLIVILAAVLRLSFLTFSPPSLNWDEVSHGYNAYSILKTGKDEWGKAFPIANFRAYGDYPLPLNLYLTIPFIATLGLNEFAIRLPHALLGILTVVAVYFLAYGITKKRNISLLSAFLVALEPWFLFTSRFVLQSNLSVFFLISGMAFFFNRERSKWLLPLSFLFLGLTLFSYHSTRIFTPLLLISMAFTYRKELRFIINFHPRGVHGHPWGVRSTPQGWFCVLIILLFFAPLPFILASPEARARANEVFLIDEGAVSDILTLRSRSNLIPTLSRLIYNRPTYFVTKFAKNYVEYFSPQFLFLKGGTQYQFSIPNFGILNPVNLPFFYLGLVLGLVGAFRGNKDYRLLVFWLILAPIPAAITKEQFAVLRSTTMLPLPQVFSALGLFASIEWISERRSQLAKFVLPVYLVLGFAFLENYLVNYFVEYRVNYSWSWQYGYQEVVNYAKANYAKYDKIIVTKKYGEPHEFFLFFMQYDPAKYRSDPNLIRFYQSNWYWIDRFDKFYFVNDWQITGTEKVSGTDKNNNKIFVLESKNIVHCNDSKCLLITSPGNFPDGWKKLTTIDFLDGKPVFDILEN